MKNNLIIFSKFKYYDKLLKEVNRNYFKIKYFVISDLEFNQEIKKIYGLKKFKYRKLIPFSLFYKSKLKNLHNLYGISFMFSIIFDCKIIDAFQNKLINFHPSLLPLNRGAHPVSWAILNNTLHGVTAHLITEKVDHGPIIFQQYIQVDKFYNAQQLYEISLNKLFEIINPTLLNFMNNNFLCDVDSLDKGSYHQSEEINKIKKFDVNSNTNFMQLINYLRAASFAPGDGLILNYEGKLYNLFLDIKEEQRNED